MTKARDAQTGILPGQEPDGGRIFLFFYKSHSIYLNWFKSQGQISDSSC